MLIIQNRGERFSDITARSNCSEFSGAFEAYIRKDSRFRIIEISDRRLSYEIKRTMSHRLRYPKPFTYRVSFDLGVSARGVAPGDICAYIRGRGVNSAKRGALYIRLAPVIIPLPNLRWQCGGGAPLSVCTGDEGVRGHLMECRLVFGRLARALTRNPRSRLRAEYQNQLLDYTTNPLTNLVPASG